MRRILIALLALTLLSGLVPVASAESAPECITVTVFRGDPGDQPFEDNKIYRKIEEELGIKFEFEFLAGELDETLNLKLADEVYPDLWDGGNSAEILENNGALIDLLPGCNMEDAPLSEGGDLNRLTAVEDADSVAALMSDLADDQRLIELYKSYGAGVKTALCRLGGRTVGLVANDHAVDGGRLTSQDSRKAARFVRLCDCYHIPVVSLVNTDGLAVPLFAHQGALLRGAADLVYAYAEATAPKLAVITGNAIGASYVAMGGRRIADMIFAWPEALIAPLTRETAVQTLDSERLNAGESRGQLEGEYGELYGALAAAKAGVVDDVIDPKETRKYLIAALELLANKRDVNLPKKHGNLPL